jgi:hypothetical protein
MTKAELWEAIKEPLRLLVLSVIPLLLVYFGTINAQWAGIIIVILRLIDSVLHEAGKSTENESLERGLTRF